MIKMNFVPPTRHYEGQSTMRLPFYNGYRFSLWKACMKEFIQIEDYEL